MKDDLIGVVRQSLDRLLQEDGSLFECPIEEGPPYDARKLHEVCINHRLANHLQQAILPLFGFEDKMFVDIEFNREGLNFKGVMIDGRKELVRPDIIVHNRRSANDKQNFLVVECKKKGSPPEDVAWDKKKIQAMMKDERYLYSYGLQVVYDKEQTEVTLFFKLNGDIVSERILRTAND
jgi:hypothetical protein